MSDAFFTSRWVAPPPGVSVLPGGLPAGFRAAGVACGLKPSGRPDLALLVSDAPGTTSAARFGRSGAPAAPVQVCRRHCDLSALRAIVANAGNANCATGRSGLDAAARVQGAGAMVAGVPEAQVAVASTGVIGVPLPDDLVVKGLAAARAALAEDGDAALAEAIRTTDAFAKRVALAVELPGGGTVRVSAQAKGAGMIQPAFATMFSFVQTDAALEAATADLLLGVCVKRSYDRISVDGQLSTNDTAILMASGASGVEIAPESDDERALGLALDAVHRQLALLIARDGEGARRVGRVHVTGGEPAAVEAVARSVANSPLVKTALHGGDPNWGRIVQAVGAALPAPEPVPFDVAIEGTPVLRAGARVPHDAEALAAAVAGDEVEYRIDLPGGAAAETEVFFSDLSHEYVTINAEYTT